MLDNPVLTKLPLGEGDTPPGALGHHLALRYFFMDGTMGTWIRLEVKAAYWGWTADLTPGEFAAWVKLLLTIKAFGNRGGTIKRVYFTKERLRTMRISTRDFTSMLGKAAADGATAPNMNGQVEIANWARFQQDPTGAERVARWREKQAPPDDVTDVTLRNGCNDDGTLRDVTGQDVTIPKKRSSKRVDYSADFETFWEAYPRKEAKGAAFKAWKALPDLPPLNELLKGLEASAKVRDFAHRETKHIPCAGPWLNGRGWEDEPAEPRKDSFTLLTPEQAKAATKGMR